MSGLAIRKVDGGYIVTHHDKEQIATAQHVANFIVQFWPDVSSQLRARLIGDESPEHTGEPDDQIRNGGNIS